MMSFENGMAAIRLEMPACIPRTEYSADGHWALVSKVTGIPVDPESDPMEKWEASTAFLKAWDYGMMWNVLISGTDLDAKRTKMGHGAFAAGGKDYNDEVTRAFSEPEEVYAIDFDEVYGAVDKKKEKGRFESYYKMMCNIYTDTVNMTGIYITAMSGYIDMLGWDMLLYAAGYDYPAFCAYANRYSRWVRGYFEALAESTVPVVMIHDDMVWTDGPFMKPDFYKHIVIPNIKRQLAPLVEAGKKILFTSDGNYTMLMEDIAACGVTGFCFEPMTDLDFAVEKFGKTHTLIGNADTRILLSGTKEDIYGEVKRCMDAGRNCPGFMLSVGNHIPANTPIENALYYNEIYMKLRKR